ncbi:MAG TPA: alpha-amylase family glycosyl hydrolase [Labilithrix sp.]|nr:alpha-amylase family glycosyl hydrolase [Labilithrix sp.]
MKTRLSSLLLLPFALSASALPGIGCVAVPEEGKQPELATWVGDWRDEVIYQVLVDRFANGDLNNDFQVRDGFLARYQGGDWRGLIDRLDYVKELGVTTLWISPVVKNVETDADVDGYHGYWAQDLTKTNPHFGELSDLRELTAACHARGLKVVLDIVTNHMGQLFFYDMNLNGNPDINLGGTGQCSPEQPGCQGQSSPVTRITEFDPDWDPRGVQAYTSLGLAGRAPLVFVQNPSINRVPPSGILGTARAYHGFGRILSYDDERQRTLGDFPGGLKDVATELPEVRAELIDKYVRWVERADLDGFRIDTVKHVELDFWREFATKVRERLMPQKKERFLMFGEAFDGNDQLLGTFTQEGMLDSVFYFSQHYQVFRDVFQYAHDAGRQKGTKQIQQLWDQRRVNYRTEPQPSGIGIAPAKSLVNFIDNHDVARFLFFANGDKPALRNALTFLMTEEGIPCLYYGTELEFSGGNDPANREVLWKTGFPTTGDTFRHFAKLARIRREHAALRHGDTTVVWATDHTGDEMDSGIFAFERAGGDAGDAYALVVFNTNARKSSVTADGPVVMKVGRPGATLVDVLNPDAESVVVSPTGELRVTVGAQSALVLVPTVR